jgi:hypothetical protein
MQRHGLLSAAVSLVFALSLACGSHEPSGDFASMSQAAGSTVPLLVAVGPGPTASTSPDGIHWFDHPFLQGVSFLTGAAWNGSVFLAIGYTSTGSSLAGSALTSMNGVDWTAHSVPVSGTLDAVAWNGAVFAAVGWGHAAASADGVTWTGQSTSFYSGVTAGGSMFVAVGPSGSVATSSDGVHWTAATNPPSGDLQAVAWNGTIFAAVGNLNGTGAVATSLDGSTWTARTVPTETGALAAIAWNGSIFVATGAQDARPDSR